MLKCLFLRSKIKKYALDILSEKQKAIVIRHVERCPGCRQELQKFKVLVASLKSNEALKIDDNFWHKFKVGLDDKLNNVLVGPTKGISKRKMSIKPILAYAVVAILLFISVPIVSFSLKKWQNISDIKFSDEFYALEEFTNSRVFNGNSFSYIDEIDLILELS